MFSFLSQGKAVLGLDLSELSLKLVQLRKKGGELSLISFGQIAIPPGLIKKGEIKDEEALADILKDLLKKVKGASLLTNQVVCNLPTEKVFIRLLQLPKMKKAEVAEAIKWEAEANFPIEISQSYLDWQIIKPLVNHLDHLDVLVVAVPRSLVKSYLPFLRKNNLEPIALEPESVALVRALLKPDELKPSVIIDLGQTKTNAVIFSANSIRFTFHLPISGQLFNQAIAKQLGISQSEADQFKIKVGLDKDKEQGRVYRALKPVVDDLVKQIQDYIDFYHNHATHVHGPDGLIAQVLLAGGDAWLTNLPAYLSSQLKLSVRLADPWIHLAPAKGLTQKQGLVYAIALGLALRELKNND